MNAARTGTSSRQAAVPGPADRETFFAAQARNRRAAGRLTVLAALGVVLMDVPMSAVISPLVYAVVIVLNDLVSLLLPVADLLRLLARLDQQPGAPALPDVLVGMLLLAGLVGPGSLLMLLSWLGARALFLAGGAAGLLRQLGAREPRPDDPEERQLQNLVEEMAIAAAVRPPRARAPGSHRARDLWLPVTIHPVFRRTWHERPLPPLPRRRWTFFSAEPEEPLRRSPASQAESGPAAGGGVAAAEGTVSAPAWRRVLTGARRYFRPRRGG